MNVVWRVCVCVFTSLCGHMQWPSLLYCQKVIFIPAVVFFLLKLHYTCLWSSMSLPLGKSGIFNFPTTIYRLVLDFYAIWQSCSHIQAATINILKFYCCSWHYLFCTQVSTTLPCYKKKYTIQSKLFSLFLITITLIHHWYWYTIVKQTYSS